MTKPPKPICFEFTYGETPEGRCASGFIVFDANLLPNPNWLGVRMEPLLKPGTEVLDFLINISGSNISNAIYTLKDYSGFRWDTWGAKLDFTKELVGQLTDSSGSTGGKDPTYRDLPWGTPGVRPDYGYGGDFSFFSVNPLAPARKSVAFTLVSDRQDGMNHEEFELQLTSMRAVPAPPTNLRIPT